MLSRVNVCIAGDGVSRRNVQLALNVYTSANYTEDLNQPGLLMIYQGPAGVQREMLNLELLESWQVQGTPFDFLVVAVHTFQRLTKRFPRGTLMVTTQMPPMVADNEPTPFAWAVFRELLQHHQVQLDNLIAYQKLRRNAHFYQIEPLNAACIYGNHTKTGFIYDGREDRITHDTNVGLAEYQRYIFLDEPIPDYPQRLAELKDRRHREEVVRRYVQKSRVLVDHLASADELQKERVTLPGLMAMQQKLMLEKLDLIDEESLQLYKVLKGSGASVIKSIALGGGGYFVAFVRPEKSRAFEEKLTEAELAYTVC